MSSPRRLYEMLRRLGYPEEIARAFGEVPREEFVEERNPFTVYSDSVVVSYRSKDTYSTSSQPSLMAEFMRYVGLSRGMKVLEVGGGTGYNAAVMSRVVGDEGTVVTIEYDEGIARKAKKNIEKLGIKNVLVINGDGYYGYKELAPYDVVFVTVGVDEIPTSWYEQLKEGGRIIAPMNLLSYALSQPAILFTKENGMLWGEYRVATGFIRAGGMLGNLHDRNRQKLEKVKCEEAGSLSLPSGALPILEIVLASMTRKMGVIYSVEEGGWAAHWSGRWRLCGEVPKFETAASEILKLKYVDIHRVRFAFSPDRSRFAFQEIF